MSDPRRQILEAHIVPLPPLWKPVRDLAHRVGIDLQAVDPAAFDNDLDVGSSPGFTLYLPNEDTSRWHGTSYNAFRDDFMFMGCIDALHEVAHAAVCPKEWLALVNFGEDAHEEEGHERLTCDAQILWALCYLGPEAALQAADRVNYFAGGDLLYIVDSLERGRELWARAGISMPEITDTVLGTLLRIGRGTWCGLRPPAKDH